MPLALRLSEGLDLNLTAPKATYVLVEKFIDRQYYLLL